MKSNNTHYKYLTQADGHKDYPNPCTLYWISNTNGWAQGFSMPFFKKLDIQHKRMATRAIPTT